MAINLVERDLVQLTFAPLQWYRIRSFIFIQKEHSLHILVYCTYVLRKNVKRKWEFIYLQLYSVYPTKAISFYLKLSYVKEE